jgi:hypothetical protein
VKVFGGDAKTQSPRNQLGVRLYRCAGARSDGLADS